VLPSCCFGPDDYDSFSEIHADINEYYQNIVNALLFAEQQTVLHIPHSALKAYWSDELDSLKEKSVFRQKIWESAGCPKCLLLQIKTKAKLNFKLAVKQAAVSFENSHCDDMYQRFLSKNTPDFWKSWNSKFRRKVMVQPCLNGSQKDSDIAECFADSFSSVHDTTDENCNFSDATFSLVINMHFMIRMIRICLVLFPERWNKLTIM